jgi:Ran GTPase-activating protein (RanGAP) involved in mRNA processing and transport
LLLVLGDYGCKKLAEALAVNETLKTFRYCNNMATADGVNAIAQAMVFNRGVTHLDLMLNPMMGDGAAASLATMLAVNETLVELNLYECGLSTEGAILLLQAAASSPSIQKMDLSSNEIDKPLIQNVVEALLAVGKTLQVTV